MLVANRQITLLYDRLAAVVESYPGRVAMVAHEEGRQLIYRQLLMKVNRYYKAMKASGVAPGSKVVAMGLLSPDFVALMFACFRIGAIFVPMDIRSSRSVFIKNMQRTRPDIFFVQGPNPYYDLRAAAVCARRILPELKHLIQWGYPQKKMFPGAVSAEKWLKSPGWIDQIKANLNQRSFARKERAIHAWQPVMMICPLEEDDFPVVLNHENVRNQIYFLRNNIDQFSNRKILTHGMGRSLLASINLLITSLLSGGTVLLSHSKNPAELLQAIENYQTELTLLPTDLYSKVFNHPTSNMRNLSSWKLALQSDISDSGKDVPNNISRTSAWLWPEAGGWVSYDDGKIPALDGCHTIGYLTNEILISVREEKTWEEKAGRPVKEDCFGEVCIHSPSVFLGYYQGEAETARVLSKDGILYTGQRGTIRSFGNRRVLYIEDSTNKLQKKSEKMLFTQNQ